MKNELIIIFVFIIVLFIYIHIFFHLKTSDDLEIYEIDAPSKEKLEEICDFRQPVIFNFQDDYFNSECNLNEINKNYSAFDVNVRNINKSENNSSVIIPITFGAMLQLFDNDKENKYISENNQDFLKETSLNKRFMSCDNFIRPYMVSNCNYDLLMSSEGYQTPLKYDLNYRNYYLVTQGKIKIKLSPPKSKKYLYPQEDYDNFEFLSPVNPWNVQDKYKQDFNKIKCLEIELTPNKMFFIPAYWWYSFEFSKNTSVCSFKYKTYMNNIAILPHIIMQFLQSQNIKRQIVKKLNVTTSTANI